jgi:hypothetical protein
MQKKKRNSALLHVKFSPGGGGGGGCRAIAGLAGPLLNAREFSKGSPGTTSMYRSLCLGGATLHSERERDRERQRESARGGAEERKNELVQKRTLKQRVSEVVVCRMLCRYLSRSRLTYADVC